MDSPAGRSGIINHKLRPKHCSGQDMKEHESGPGVLAKENESSYDAHSMKIWNLTPYSKTLYRVTRILTLIWLVLVVVLSLLPPYYFRHVPQTEFMTLNQLAHIVFYFGLSFLFLCSESFRRQKAPGLLYSLFPATLSFVIGLVVEGLQKYLFSYRRGLWADVLDNGLGILLSLVFFHILRWLLPLGMSHFRRGQDSLASN